MEWIKEEVGDIIEFWEEKIRRYADRLAFQIKKGDAYHKVFYGELGNRAADVSSTLIKLGIEKGERCAILSESRPEWGIAFFGIMMAGGIVTPLDIKLKGNEIQYFLNHSQAKCIFTSNKSLSALSKRLTCQD